MGCEVSVIVYSTPSCIQCDQTKRLLKREGIAFEDRPVEDYPAEVEALKARVGRTAPLVDTGLEAWSGFRPDLIKSLARG